MWKELGVLRQRNFLPFVVAVVCTWEGWGRDLERPILRKEAEYKGGEGKP